MNRWARTVSEAAEMILSGMKAADKRIVRDTPEEKLNKFHFGWGQGIRNSMGLWAGNTELLEDTGKSHPDDASMVIIHAVWKELQSMNDAEIEASSVSNENRVDLKDLQKMLFELEGVIQKRVPRGVKCSAKCNDGNVSVVVAPVDDLLTREIEDCIQKRVPRGVNCSVKCDDRSVAAAASLVDDPLTQCDFSSIRRFSGE